MDRVRSERLLNQAIYAMSDETLTCNSNQRRIYAKAVRRAVSGFAEKPGDDSDDGKGEPPLEAP